MNSLISKPTTVERRLPELTRDSDNRFILITNSDMNSLFVLNTVCTEYSRPTVFLF